MYERAVGMYASFSAWKVSPVVVLPVTGTSSTLALTSIVFDFERKRSARRTAPPSATAKGLRRRGRPRRTGADAVGPGGDTGKREAPVGARHDGLRAWGPSDTMSETHGADDAAVAIHHGSRYGAAVLVNRRDREHARRGSGSHGSISPSMPRPSAASSPLDRTNRRARRGG